MSNERTEALYVVAYEVTKVADYYKVFVIAIQTANAPVRRPYDEISPIN